MTTVTANPQVGAVTTLTGQVVPAGGYLLLPTFTSSIGANARATHIINGSTGDLRLTVDNVSTDPSALVPFGSYFEYAPNHPPNADAAYKYLYNPGASNVTCDIELYRRA